MAGMSGCSAKKSGESAASSDRPKVAFVTNCVASFWVIAGKGVDEGGREFDVEVETVMPTGGTTDQQQILEDLVTRGYDGIAVSPIDPTNQSGLIDRLSADTRIITQDSDAPNSKRLCYIGMDNYDAGIFAGELCREALPDGGKVAIFVGNLEQDNARRRRQGTIDGLLGRPRNANGEFSPDETIEENGYTILPTYTDKADVSAAKSNAEDALARHPDIGLMIGLFVYNPPTILEALKQADKMDDVKIVGFDEDDVTLQGIIDGNVHGTVVQNPFEYGRQSVKTLAGLIRGESLESLGFDDKGVMHIPARQIRQDNAQTYWDELKEQTSQDVD